MLIHETDGRSLGKIVETTGFVVIHYVALIVSIVYGWFLRIHVHMNWHIWML